MSVQVRAILPAEFTSTSAPKQYSCIPAEFRSTSDANIVPSQISRKISGTLLAAEVSGV